MDWVNPTPPLRRIQQQTTSTCWLAACQMLYGWKNKPLDEVTSRLKNSSDTRVDFDTWYQLGIDHGDLVPLAKALGFRWGAGGKATAGVIADTMKLYGPIIVVGAWNTYSHVIVIADAEDAPMSDGEYNSKSRLRIANPWFGCDEREERNLTWLNGGLGHWSGVNGQYMHW